MDVKRTFITIARPIGDNHGTVDEGYYTVDAGTLTLTDSAGIPIPRTAAVTARRTAPKTYWTAPLGDRDPAQVARELMWQRYRARKSGTDLNRPIRYPDLGIA